jgi:hypothetical protein
VRAIARIRRHKVAFNVAALMRDPNFALLSPRREGDGSEGWHELLPHENTDKMDLREARTLLGRDLLWFRSIQRRWSRRVESRRAANSFDAVVQMLKAARAMDALAYSGRKTRPSGRERANAMASRSVSTSHRHGERIDPGKRRSRKGSRPRGVGALMYALRRANVQVAVNAQQQDLK